MIYIFICFLLIVLISANQVAAEAATRKIDLHSYLIAFGDMPRGWQMVISSLFIVLMAFLLLRILMRIYFAAERWYQVLIEKRPIK